MAIVLTDNTNYTNIANAIRQKGVTGTFTPSQMPNAILQISGGSETPHLWCGGDNPILVTDDPYPQTYTLTQLGYGDTITPTTTKKTVKSSGALFSVNLPITYADISNYDFVGLSWLDYNIVYTTDPTRRVIKGGQITVQNLWDCDANDTKVTNQQYMQYVMYRTDSNGNIMQTTDNNYVLSFSGNPFNTLSNKNYQQWRNPIMYTQVNNTYMPQASFDLIDYDLSTFTAHAYIYRVDKGTCGISVAQSKLIERLNTNN